MNEDYFCIFVFLYFYESSKISVLKEWAELVASQLTQVIYLCKLNVNEKISGGKVVFT